MISAAWGSRLANGSAFAESDSSAAPTIWTSRSKEKLGARMVQACLTSAASVSFERKAIRVSLTVRKSNSAAAKSPRLLSPGRAEPSICSAQVNACRLSWRRNRRIALPLTSGKPEWRNRGSWARSSSGERLSSASIAAATSNGEGFLRKGLTTTRSDSLPHSPTTLRRRHRVVSAVFSLFRSWWISVRLEAKLVFETESIQDVTSAFGVGAEGAIGVGSGSARPDSAVSGLATVEGAAGQIDSMAEMISGSLSPVACFRRSARTSSGAWGKTADNLLTAPRRFSGCSDSRSAPDCSMANRIFRFRNSSFRSTRISLGFLSTNPDLERFARTPARISSTRRRLLPKEASRISRSFMGESGRGLVRNRSPTFLISSTSSSIPANFRSRDSIAGKGRKNAF